MKSLLLIASLVVLGACATTKVPERLAECKAVVEAWAGQEPIQGVPQGDGGVIFIKPKLDGSNELLILVSKKNEGKVMQDVKQNVKTAVVTGECAHPLSGYAYTTLQFTVAPQLSSVGN